MGRKRTDTATSKLAKLRGHVETAAKGGSLESDLENLDTDKLDAFERMQYMNFEKSVGKAQALKVLINNVEGDYSQLSPKLRAIAKKYKMKDGGYMAEGGETQEAKLRGKKPPTDATIRLHMNSYTIADDPYKVATEIGKIYGWNEEEVGKAEDIIRKKYIKKDGVYLADGGITTRFNPEKIERKIS